MKLKLFIVIVNQQGKKTLTALLLVLTASATLQKYMPAAETKGGFKKQIINLHVNDARFLKLVWSLSADERKG